MVLVVLGLTCAAGEQNAWGGDPYTVTDLGTLGGMQSEAFAVNASGQVAGWSNVNSSATDAFLDSGSAMVDFGTLGNNQGGAARGINSSGQVVGFVYNSANH